MMRLRRERTMDGYDVGSFHQLGEWHVGHAPLLEDLIRDWVEGQERASEPLKDIGHDRANAASSHDPDRSVAEIEPKQAIQREVPLPDPDIRPVQLAVERQDERDGMFGDCFGGIGRHRSEEHTSELQSHMRISYAVFCLKKKKKDKM